MTDPIEEYKYLLALHLRDINRRYGILYYDVLRGKMPEEARGLYAEGLVRVFDYMNSRHGLDIADVMAIHETVMEITLTDFVVGSLDNSTLDNPQVLH